MSPSRDDLHRADWWVILAALALTGVGLVLVYSTAAPLSFGREGADGASLFRRSGMFALLGIIALALATRVRAELLGRWAYPLLGLSVVLLILPWLPKVGLSVKGAHRWVRFGSFGFQPSEVTKLTLAVFLAHNLAKRGKRVGSFAYGYLPTVLIPAVPLVLVLAEPDLGTAALMAAMVLSVAFVAGVRTRHLVAGLTPLIPPLIYLLWFVPFRRERILAFLHPWEHATGAGFQLVQSLLAFGTGGPWGVGLGAGRQKLYYLPEAHTDFILSVWAEERGLLGIVMVVALFAVIVVRGYRIALRQDDPYRRFLATALTTWIGLQAALNALVVTGCVPTKGIPLPFVSYGGTGLVVSLAAVGLLAGLAREAPGCAS